MLDFPRWKVWSIWLVILLGIAFAVPSMFPKSEVANWPKWAPRTQINLGLDLAGGSQLLLEADSRDAAKQRLQAKEDEVTTELRRGEPRIAIGDVSTQGGRLSFMVRDPAQLDAAVERMRTLTRPSGSDRPARLGRVGRRFDADRPDPDRGRHGQGAEGIR